MPKNRSVPDVQNRRKCWKADIAGSKPEKLVFLDESGINIDMTRLYGRALSNERAVDNTLLNTPTTTTKTAEQCLKIRLDFIKDPKKTKDGELISTFSCSAELADREFLLMRDAYLAYTGRSNANEIIAYQLRQSFKPGEVTPEEANRIGYELASRFLSDEHAFIVATHNDRHHVHNHIIFCPITLDAKRKFRNVYRSDKALAELSDQICLENGLSVIREANGKTESYEQSVLPNADHFVLYIGS